jgi:hypothetical protein
MENKLNLYDKAVIRIDVISGPLYRVVVIHFFIASNALLYSTDL